MRAVKNDVGRRNEAPHAASIDAPLIPPVVDPSPVDALPRRDAPLPHPGPQGDHAPAPMSMIGSETAYSVITDVDLFGMSSRINSVYNLDFLDDLLD